MDTAEARQVLERRVAALRRLAYPDLRDAWLHRPDCELVRGESGTEYQVEIEAYWDDPAGGHLRLVASIDDGGWRALSPLCDGFVVAPDGSFVGE